MCPELFWIYTAEEEEMFLYNLFDTK
uniref:Uncharacterized protein n=1 Tax=Anguilla anguilla TaxID=7936 RepID=A0A0E9U0V5_ANGAN